MRERASLITVHVAWLAAAFSLQWPSVAFGVFMIPDLRMCKHMDRILSVFAGLVLFSILAPGIRYQIAVP